MDPAAKPQLAVPISVPQHLLRSAKSAKQQTVAHLANVAFFYLLRVGEYTHTSSTRSKLTVAFQVKDITFRKNGNIVPASAPLATLQQCDEATMRITNQKNGLKGQCIHHQCNGTWFSPVKSLIWLVHNILSRGGSPTSPIAEYYPIPGRPTPMYINATDINKALKEAGGAIGLYAADVGFKPTDISSHSLRAGGAMAMHLNGVSEITIRKQGRWKSSSFMLYIQEHIHQLTAGLSTKMATSRHYRNIGNDSPNPTGSYFVDQ